MEKKYYQCYKKAWETNPLFKDWISPDPSDKTRVFCKFCKTSLKAHKKDLISHASTLKHKRCGRDVPKFVTIDKFCSKTRAQKISELKLSVFIAEHCSIRSIDHLSELLPSIDPASSILTNLKLHRTKATMLIKNVIGPAMLSSLIEDIGESSFSLIIDESTDISTMKTLCLVIKYPSLKNSQIVTSFYRIVEVQKTDAKSIYETVINQLAEDKLPLKNLLGIGVDGANTMIGQNLSVSALLQRDVADLVTVKCVCHSLHLCAEYACKELPKQLEFLIREIHSYFSHSPKRLSNYQNIYKSLKSSTPVKVPKLSGTRWLAREAAVTVVLDQWEDLYNFFKLAYIEEKCFTAEQIVKIMECPAYKACLVFLKITLSPICATNRLFQSEEQNSLKLFEDLIILYKTFLKKIVVPSQLQKVTDCNLLNFEFKNFIMHADTVYFGHEFEELARKLNEPDKADVRKRCIHFLIEFCCQLRRRLPSNVDLLEKINVFSPEICTSQKRQPITNTIKTFKRFDVTACENEWDKLPLKKWNNVHSTVDFWMEVLRDHDSAGYPRFKNIATAALSLLSLPLSNAAVERIFSIYNNIKNKIRCRLSLEVIQGILTIRETLRIQGIGCVNFNPSDNMLNLFNTSMYSANNTDNAVIDFLDELGDIDLNQ